VSCGRYRRGRPPSLPHTPGCLWTPVRGGSDQVERFGLHGPGFNEQVWVSRSACRVQIVFDMWAGPVYGWEDGGCRFSTGMQLPRSTLQKEVCGVRCVADECPAP